MQLYKPGIAWPNADNNPWPIMEEASDEGEYYYKEDVHDQLTQLRGNLSLAEEGMANYAQENAQLKEQLRTAIPAIATLKETRQELEAQLGWMIQHAGVEWHGWWSSRIGETSEPLRSQIKALLYPDGYPSERPAVPQPAEHCAQRHK